MSFRSGLSVLSAASTAVLSFELFCKARKDTETAATWGTRRTLRPLRAKASRAAGMGGQRPRGPLSRPLCMKRARRIHMTVCAKLRAGWAQGSQCGHLPGAPLGEGGGVPNRALHRKKTEGRSQCREDRPGGRAGPQLGGPPARPAPNRAKASLHQEHRKCFENPKAKNPATLTRKLLE